MGFQIDIEDKRHKYPVIQRVPIAVYRAGGFCVTVPIKVGDEGMAIFADKNIDFLQNSSFVNENFHYHELTDAIFIPGIVYTLSPVKEWDTEKISIRNEENTARITIAPNGDIELKTDAKILFNAEGGIESNTAADIISNAGGNVKTTAGGQFTVNSTNMDLAASLTIKGGNITASGTVQGAAIVAASGTGGTGGITASGDIRSTGGDVIAGSVTLKTHTHPYTWTDPGGSGNTGAPT